jgi:hypothetical protein
MRLGRTTALCLVLLAANALAKTRKSDVPAAFNQATYVFVESDDGDLARPGLYPADRQAIMDVEAALRDWKRYSIAANRSQAELIFVVRKGRLADTQLHGGIASASQVSPGRTSTPSPGQGSGQSSNRVPGQMGDGEDAGARADIGSADDMLEVFQLTPDGKLIGPIWNRTQTDGLEAPQLALFRQLKGAVEKAYPDPANKQPKP